MTTDAIRMALKPVPGPKGLPVLGNINQIRQGELFDTLLSMHETFGDIVRFTIFTSGNLYSIRHPDMFQHVLQMNNQNYWKGERIQVAKPLIGDGIFISEGERWRRQRRMMQPAFHRRQIDLLAAEMTASLEEMLADWELKAATGATLNVQNAMMTVTMEIVTRTLFTNSLTPTETAEAGSMITCLLETINRRGQRIISFGDRLPTRANRRFEAGIRQLDQLIFRLIDDRRRERQAGADLLGMLLSARDETTGEGMNDRQLRDELVTMFLAGHETTAMGLSWSFALLSQNPAVRRRLQEEVDSVLGGRKPTAADFRSLPYTRAVFEEALRLYPPLVFTIRQSFEEDELGGYPIPGGSSIFINFFALHRHPDFWDNPQGFDPQRFLPENREGRHKFAFIPFGGGPRQCIGNDFALMEGVLTLAMVSQRFELNLAPGARIEPKMSSTLRPRYGVPVTLKQRAAT